MSGQIQRADPTSVRRWNEYAVITALRELSPQKISALAAATGLTPAPLGGVLRGLIEKNWVDALDPVVGGVGRPAQQFSLHDPDGALLGLDIGAHCVRGVATALRVEVLRRSEHRLPASPSADDILAAVAAVVEDCGSEAPVWLTCVAITGFVDGSGRLVHCAAIPEWEGLKPLEHLADVLPSRAIILNDIRAAAVAELQVGAARGVEDFVLLHLGRRPTLGLVLDGVPRRGSQGVAGRISRNPLSPASDDSEWLRRFADGGDALGNAVQAAADGDEEALAGIRSHAGAIMPSLVLATSLVETELVVVAGALAPLSEHVVEGLAREALADLQPPPRLVASPLDQYAAALGAAHSAAWVVEDSLSNPTFGVLPLTLEEFDSHPLPRP